METIPPTESANQNFHSRESRDELLAFIERIEKWERQKQEVAEEVKEVFRDAQNRGYDVKALRSIIKKRKMKKQERLEQESIIDTYMAILGMDLD